CQQGGNGSAHRFHICHIRKSVEKGPWPSKAERGLANTMGLLIQSTHRHPIATLRGVSMQSNRTTLFVLFLGLTASLVFAQSDTGSLSGTVKDPNGAVVAGAKLKIKNDQTGRELDTTSTDSGLYVFPNLTAGPYSLTVEHPGFKKVNRSNIVIA